MTPATLSSASMTQWARITQNVIDEAVGQWRKLFCATACVHEGERTSL